MYYDKETPAAAIYYLDAEILCEIFGVDYAGNEFRSETFSGLLTRVLNECKRNGKKHMVFFNGEESRQTALDAGFRCVGEYVLFLGKG